MTTPLFTQEFGGILTAKATSVTAAGTTLGGHLLAVGVEMYIGASGNITTLTDDGGNTYYQIAAYSLSGHNGRLSLWYSFTTASNSTGLTANLSTSMDAVMTVVDINPHGGTWGVLDPYIGVVADTSTPASGTTAALTTATDVAVGFIGQGASNQVITGGGSGYTSCYQRNSTATSALVSILAAYKLTATQAGEEYDGSMAAAKYAGAGVTTFTWTPPVSNEGQLAMVI
ncbi:MAG: hypothetical protein ACRDFB_06435 [Rhabdochlamydiaceae bacterium]